MGHALRRARIGPAPVFLEASRSMAGQQPKGAAHGRGDPCPLHHLDPGVVAGGGGEAPIARHQERIERLGQGNVEPIMASEAMPQLPDPRQQPIMRVAVERKIAKIGEKLAPPLRADLTGRSIPADDMRHLCIQHVRRVQHQT